MGLGSSILEEAKGTLEWGFDLTGFDSKEDAEKVWKAMGLSTTPTKKKPRAFLWSRKGLDIICANNPFEGQKVNPSGSALGTLGYCSYIGIRGDAADVKKAVSAIKKYGDYKDESPKGLDFIGFSDVDD